MDHIKNKIIVISAGASGIGAEIAKSLSENGASVIVGDKDEVALKRLENDHPEIRTNQVDVSNESEVLGFFEDITSHFGKIDALINNAGVAGPSAMLGDTSLEDWEKTIKVNLNGTFLCSKSAIPLLKKSGGGSIINIGSISGQTADPGLALYNASKAFVHGLTRSIAVDHGPHLRCNAICPGWIMTGMADAAFAVATNPDVAREDALARHPAGRFGQPSDIAAMAAWLASDQSGFTTGQCFVVDGGLTAASPLNPGLF